MKLLSLDIETSPNLVFTWGLRKISYIGLNQVVEFSRPICMAYQWIDMDVHGARPGPMKFLAEWKRGGRMTFVERCHTLLTEADAVVTYNGAKFDLPKLTGMILKAGYSALPDPAHVDLYRAIKKLGYPSSKMEHAVSELLGIHKMETGGFDLWRRVVLDRDPAARAQMEAYNRQDVNVTTQLLQYLWERGIRTGLPNLALYEGTGTPDAPACRNCAQQSLRKEGMRVTAAGAYQRYKCTSCGAWSQAGRRVAGADVR